VEIYDSNFFFQVFIHAFFLFQLLQNLSKAMSVPQFKKVMKIYYYDLFFGLYPLSLSFSTTTFRGMALPSSSGEPTWVGPVDRASLCRQKLSTKNAFLETLWLKNIGMMDEVQKIDRSNTTP
jgi:hypothetical protein